MLFPRASNLLQPCDKNWQMYCLIARLPKTFLRRNSRMPMRCVYVYWKLVMIIISLVPVQAVRGHQSCVGEQSGGEEKVHQLHLSSEELSHQMWHMQWYDRPPDPTRRLYLHFNCKYFFFLYWGLKISFFAGIRFSNFQADEDIPRMSVVPPVRQVHRVVGASGGVLSWKRRPPDFWDQKAPKSKSVDKGFDSAVYHLQVLITALMRFNNAIHRISHPGAYFKSLCLNWRMWSRQQNAILNIQFAVHNVDNEGKSIYTIQIEQKTYELTGFVTHEGGQSIQSGHYTFVAVEAPYEATGLAFLCSDADEPRPIADVANHFARSYIQVSQPLFSKKNYRS